MYKLIDFETGEKIGIVEYPTYIFLGKNGCYQKCKEKDAQGIAYNSTPYNLFGKESMGDLPTVILAELDAGKELESIQSTMRTVQEQTANTTFMSSQLQTVAMLYVRAATDIPDTIALSMPDLFLTWGEALKTGTELAANVVINDGGQLYRVASAVTPLENQAPHDDGMLAVYRPIDVDHTGALEDPIPFVNGMDTSEGKYYSYNGKVYLCKSDMKPCVCPPDTAGLWQWEEVAE